MRFLNCLQLLFLIIVPGLVSGQHGYLVSGNTREVPYYRIDRSVSYSILHMGYASAEIRDAELWNRSNKNITEVDIVFTAYPRNRQDWLTDYDWLLNRRIQNLQELEPALKNNPAIKWNFILQTSCKNAQEAGRMFHGAVIKYNRAGPMGKPTTISGQGGVKEELAAINQTIETVAYGLTGFEDSVVFKTFSRNEWKKMLIVNDWTGSMYPYGAQAILWHRINFEKNAVKYFIFFNDGNQKLDRQKRIGNTGGIYYSPPDSIEYLLKVMKLVAKRGNGGDIPENNIEALLKAIRLFRGYDELVMIADNNAGVRDMILLDRVSRPVRVVLCGVTKDQPVHPHYLEIARATGGSVHTLEEDIAGLHQLQEGQTVEIAGFEYILHKGKLLRRTQKDRASF